jgi:hypothetical protein
MKFLRALAPILILAACDDPTIITHVDKLSHMRLNDLLTMQDAGAVPVEIHGDPFQGASRGRIAGSMRPPSGGPQGIRFQAVGPGAWAPHRDWRIVLHFNPNGPPNSQQDCKRRTEADTAPRPNTGYSVNFTICKGEAWQAHGFLQAPDTGQDDLEVFSDHMVQLMMAIFAENSDVDR